MAEVYLYLDGQVGCPRQGGGVWSVLREAGPPTCLKVENTGAGPSDPASVRATDAEHLPGESVSPGPIGRSSGSTGEETNMWIPSRVTSRSSLAGAPQPWCQQSWC